MPDPKNNKKPNKPTPKVPSHIVVKKPIHGEVHKPAGKDPPRGGGKDKPGIKKEQSAKAGAVKPTKSKIDKAETTADDKRKHGKDDPKTEAGNKKTKKGQLPEPENLKGDSGKRIFSERLMHGMLPLRWFLSVFGHFPMDYKQEKNGSYTFTFTWLHIRGILFGIIGIISFYAFIIGGFNFATIVLSSEVNITKDGLTEREAELYYETALMARHIMPVMSMLAAILQSVVVCFHLFQKRHYIASIYTYHSQVAQQLHIDLSDGIFWASLTLMGIYCVIVMAILLMAALRFSPMTVGSPTLFGIFMLRLFTFGDGLWIDHTTKTRITVQVFGGMFLMIIYTSSKCQMLMFIYHCKLLRNAFSAWNGRFYVTMKKGAKFVATEDGRTTFQLLYKDHTVLIDLLEGTNRIFSTIIESYYALQLATIFFEIYFFLRTAKYGDDPHEAARAGGQYFIRDNDWLPGLFLTFLSVSIALATVKMASDVGEEAMAGVDIARRKTMLGRKTDAELLFQLSLQASYNSFTRFDIGGGGYEYLNKDWIMGYINNIMGYFIILYQFQPLMDIKTGGNWKARRALGEFYTNLENIRPGHWKSTPAPPPVVYLP